MHELILICRLRRTLKWLRPWLRRLLWSSLVPTVLPGDRGPLASCVLTSVRCAHVSSTSPEWNLWNIINTKRQNISTYHLYTIGIVLGLDLIFKYEIYTCQCDETSCVQKIDLFRQKTMMNRDGPLQLVSYKIIIYIPGDDLIRTLLSTTSRTSDKSYNIIFVIKYRYGQVYYVLCA